MIRGPVVTRKNACGSHNGDTARNAAVIWTVTGTAQMAGLHLTYLTAYLDECGRNRGKPLTGPALERFLPCVMSSARIMGPGRCHDLGTTFWLLCHLGVCGGIRQAEWAGPVSLRVPAARARQPP